MLGAGEGGAGVVGVGGGVENVCSFADIIRWLVVQCSAHFKQTNKPRTVWAPSLIDERQARFGVNGPRTREQDDFIKVRWS